ncbi:diguanylate cyclase [Alteromonas sp. ASW11-19]|uniref:diguanylate cyclase n=1 Tax=Alteromonas salexigens TaxID=2982530 RepID=A0ABT2VK85_9ALTE|nr:diguanylate cyclase [Alteromonas salexigens]MCU7553690.1 diguanylate cyclase [Alteromonas salexigens]
MQQQSSRTIQDCHVLIVDDQPSSRLILESLLEDMVECSTTDSASKAIAFCRAQRPDLVLMDVVMPDMSGHDACRLLADIAETSQIPVIFVTGSATDEEQEKCWDAGGVDFVEKPVNPTTLRNRVKSHLNHKMKTDLLEQLIYLDRLTGAFNRHYLEDSLPGIIRDCLRHERDLAFILFDIDFFKQYNDEYGHLQGDTCLHKVSHTTMHSLLRPRDKLIRVGGEEFLVVLPETDTAGALAVAQRLLTVIKALAIPHQHSPEKVVTVSAGVAEYQPSDDRNLKKAVSRADTALYEAKSQGRNCVVVYDVALEGVSE